MKKNKTLVRSVDMYIIEKETGQAYRTEKRVMRFKGRRMAKEYSYNTKDDLLAMMKKDFPRVFNKKHILWEEGKYRAVVYLNTTKNPILLFL